MANHLGLERFYQYSGIASGAGSALLVNAFTGNAVFSYTPLSNPGRGLATFVRMSYNSMDGSDSPTGPGWSLSTSTLSRLGSPLQFRGDSSYPTLVTLIDGDGTSHRFTLNKNGTADRSRWSYDPPAGVQLLLQRTSADDLRRWSTTSPDRTRTYFDAAGYQTATVDHNGNQMLFTYQSIKVGNRNSKMLRYLTDPAGRRTLSLDYYQPGDRYAYFSGTKRRTASNLKNTSIAYRLKSITDATGREMTFTYSDRGQLAEHVDGAGTPYAKAFTFTYERNKLVRVIDPNGNASVLRYYTKPAGKLRNGRVLRLTDRRGNQTGFQYADPDGRKGSTIVAQVNDGNGHPTRYRLDGHGRTIRATNAQGESTRLAWDADNNVRRLLESNGALTTWVYDPRTGYPLEIRDAEANARNLPPTRLGYQRDPDGYVADLTEKTSPEGRRWQFTYDERGNLVAVTDPKGTSTSAPEDYTSRYTYDTLGHLTTVSDANGHTTTYADYDVNGYPRRVTDPLGCSSFFGYDSVGNVTSTVDARHTERTFTYDTFKRPLATRIPKSTLENDYIVTPGPRYDANDNVLTLTTATGKTTKAAYDENDQLVAITAPKDTPDGPQKTSTLTYDRAGNLIKEIQPKGSLTNDPNDFVTRYTYDEINQPLTVTDAVGQRSQARYDNVGNLVAVVDPNKTRTADPADYTTKYTYDLNHRVTRTTDADGQISTTRYDRDGNPVEATDEEGNTSSVTLDERGMPTEVRAPHSRDGNGIRYFTTRYDYDQVGNRTRTITGRGVETTDDPDDFTETLVYDALNRVVEQQLPYDRDHARVKTPDSIFYAYDQIGQLREVSSPPSQGQSVRNVNRNNYYDNGWLKETTDPWGIRTRYQYNEIGQQTNRTIFSADGYSSRTMTWDYYPNGKLKARSDDGLPVGQHTVLVDNSDLGSTAAGDWDTIRSGPDHQGFDYQVSTATADAFTWKADIPASGNYQVFARYPRATATDATYTVEHNGGATTAKVDQTQHAGQWVKLGTFAFTEDNLRNITLSGKANGTVAADAIRLVRDNTRDVDAEKKTFRHRYDANDNLVSVTDASSGALVDEYAIGYDALNRATSMEERKNGTVRNATGYGYDPNGNLTGWRHDDQSAKFTYDNRDLLTSVTNRATSPKVDDKVTTFSYTARSLLKQQVKPNGNTVDFDYYLDGLLRHQVENKKGNGVVVNEHTLDYDANSQRSKDAARRQNADNHNAYLDDVSTYTFDPRDRVEKVTKSVPDGAVKSTETYVHDANNNVTDQTVAGTTTTFSYDRNRLVSATAADTTSNYGYDPFGRLTKVTTGGKQSERYVFDGFDRIQEYRQGSGDAASLTRYSYDPLDRTVTRRSNDGGGGPKTTKMDYLGLSEQVLTERVDGEIRKSYQYGAQGELLGLVNVKDNGTKEASYYGYNTRSDVESLTSGDGNNRSTYGYTAYGQDDTASFTGADKPAPDNSNTDPENVYRFNTKRWDSASGNYDMGFRDYSPGENRFLSLDLYNGALADLGLSVNPFTMNRYAFAGGNPISMIDQAGHWPSLSDIGHAALDVAGLVPVVGEVADLANGAWYAAEGNYVDAALSFASAIPLAGYAATAVKAGRYAKRGVDAVETTSKVADDAAAAAGRATRGKPDSPSVAREPDAPSSGGSAPDTPSAGKPPGQPSTGSGSGPSSGKAPAATPASPSAPKAAGPIGTVNTGKVAVYTSTSAAGKVDYVGITNNLSRRAAAHLGSKGITIQGVPGLANLSRRDARSVEQVLIQEYGGPKGSQLLNKINSISTNNPIYGRSIRRGCSILSTVGYAAPNVC